MMPENTSETDEQADAYEKVMPVSRRRLLRATAVGAAGPGIAVGSDQVRAAETDHDHSGDRLGVEAPVESITVDTVTVRDLDQPENFVVFEEDGRWYGYKKEHEEIRFEDTDGVAVINDAIEECGNLRDSRVQSNGTVRVVADAGGTVLESDTTIDHVHHGVKLVLEPGVTFEYTGEEEAVYLEASNNSYLYFDVIDANGAPYCIRDHITGTGRTEGNVLRGASDSLWITDVPEGSAAGAGQYINVREFDCTAHPTPYGFRAPSPDLRGGTEGYWFDIGIVRGPTEVGLKIGEEGLWSVGFFVFDTFIDGATNDARRLVEINNRKHGVILRGFTPATGGDWDVVMGTDAVDCPVIATTRRHDLRIKRETLQTANPAKFDAFSPEVVKTELRPESLAGFETALTGSGDVTLSGEEGRVKLQTGSTLDSLAGIRRSVPDFADVSFDHQAAIQTNIMVPADLGYTAWLLWGDRDGPAVGWHIAEDRLLGYASDGESETTEPLLSEGDVNESDAWNLTAFYNPPTDIHYYVDDLTTYTTTTSTGAETEVTALHPDINENLAIISRSKDPRWAGRITSNLPSGDAGARRIMTIELENELLENRTLEWSNWRNYRYPLNGDGGDAS